MMSFVHLFTPSVINQPTRSTTLTGRPHNIYIPAPISYLFSQQHSYIFNSYHLNLKQTNQFNMSDFGRQSLGDSESGFSPLHFIHFSFLSLFSIRPVRAPHLPFLLSSSSLIFPTVSNRPPSRPFPIASLLTSIIHLHFNDQSSR